MIDASINPKDLAEFHIATNKIEKEVEVTSNWRRLLIPLKRELRVYPAELPNQKYVRTKTLKEAWEYSISGKTAEMENLANYAGWVQGVDKAPIHEGRWSVFVEVGERHLEEFIKSISEKVGKIWTK